MTNWIQVIINPASGQPEPILNTLNRVFREAGIRWTVSITQESGDATRFARQAIADGVDVVAAYGGDGTVMEVAHGVTGGDVPMVILPGGTANLMAVELSIPKNLAGAAAIACDPKSQIRRVDMGEAGNWRFMLRLGRGIAGEKVRLADRELKDRYGLMVYTIAGLKALKDARPTKYRLILDGEPYEMEGLTCLVDNAGNLVFQNFKVASNIRVDDGLLDVLILQESKVSSLIAIAAQVTEHGPDPRPDQIFHRKAREILIETDPPLLLQGDGEIWGILRLK